jgi:hypothetical protein
VTVGELLAAGEVRGMGGRGIGGLYMHGRGTGDDGPLVARLRVTEGHTPDLHRVELQENCCMVVKPNVEVDGKLDYGHWGETVVIRKHGAERLGTRPQALYELG